MAYDKTVWENSPSTRTPINKDNLNKIEEGIYNALEKYTPSDSESSIEKVDSLRSKNKALEFKIGEQWYTVVTKGLDGLTFTPNVSDDGIISWTNNGSVENPEPKNIKGPKGVSLRYRGLYSSDTSYEFNESYIDLVTYKNSLWIKNNTNQSEPGLGNDWSLAAKQGEKGDKGDIGNTPNITVGTVSGLPAGSTPKVTITGTPENPVINFSIPKGDKGDKGDIPVLGVGNIETLPEGSQATASISGTNENPRINLGIPRGNTGRQGDTGKTPNLTIGTVETVDYGIPSEAEITGSAENPILNLKLQKGKDGEGSGDMSKSIYDTNDDGIVNKSDNAVKTDKILMESTGAYIPKNYKDTTVHGVDTLERNLVANGNKIEVLGQTIQNCLDHSSVDKFNSLDGSLDENGYIAIIGDGNYKPVIIKKDFCIIKPATTYTWIIDVIENTLNPNNAEIELNNDVGSTITFFEQKLITAKDLKVGINKFAIRSKDNISSAIIATRTVFSYVVNSGSIKFRIAIVEGDWTSKEFSYIPFGLNYPKTTEVIECGKNLFDVSKIPATWNGTYGIKNNGDGTIYLKNTSSSSAVPTKMKLKDLCPWLEIGKKYLLSYENSTYQDNKEFYLGEAKKHWYVDIPLQMTSEYLESMVYMYPSLTVSTEATLSNFQIEEAEAATEYEPYTERKVNINYPLASVSDSIRDKYYVKDGKKYHDKIVDKYTLTGYENVTMWNGYPSDIGSTGFYIKDLLNYNLNTQNWLCDKIEVNITGALTSRNTIRLRLGGDYSLIYLAINNGELETLDVDGCKKWLQQKQPTLMYELATPITTEIETEDLQSFDGQTNITTTNEIKPTLDIDLPTTNYKNGELVTGCILERSVKADEYTNEQIDNNFINSGLYDLKELNGTTINCGDTVARNLSNINAKIEVLGQTIQNCLDHSSADKFDLFSGTVDENGYINISTDGDRKYFYNKKESLVVKPNTQYTFIVEVLENTTTAGGIVFGGSGVTCYFSIVKAIPYNEFKGIIKFTAYTNNEFDSVTSGIGNTIQPETTGGILKFRYAIVEGDWTNKEISFVPFGLNYPAITEIVATGKNLFNGNSEINIIPDKGNIDSGYNIYENDVLKAYSNVYSVFPRGVLLKNLKGKTISVSAHVDKMGSAIRAGVYIYENYETSPVNYDLGTNVGDLKINAYEVKSDVLFVCFGGTLTDSPSKLSNPVEYSNIQIEISSMPTEYEPYTERIININKPLALVSDIFCDKYYVKNGNKYHDQIIKEVIYDGSDDEGWSTSQYTNLCAYIGVDDLTLASNYLSFMCDKFAKYPRISDKPDRTIGVAVEGVNLEKNGFFFGIKGLANDLPSWKQYLKSNPIKILYAIREPIITEIETEDMQSFNGQTNIATKNEVKPNINIELPIKSTNINSSKLKIERNVTADEYSNSEIDMRIKGVSKIITIKPSEWVEGVYTLYDNLITDISDQEFILPSTSEVSKDIIKMIQKANIVSNSQGKGFSKIECIGIVPTEEIKLIVKFKS